MRVLSKVVGEAAPVVRPPLGLLPLPHLPREALRLKPNLPPPAGGDAGGEPGEQLPALLASHPGERSPLSAVDDVESALALCCARAVSALRCSCLDDNPRETARGRESSPSSTTVATRGRPGAAAGSVGAAQPDRALVTPGLARGFSQAVSPVSVFQ